MAGNETGFLDIVVGVNNVLMYEWLGDFFLIGITAVLFMALVQSTNSVPRAGMGTFFVIFVLSLSFVALGLSHTQTPFFALTLFALSFIGSYFEK
jgi:hypothetical protein